jgi:hypothetical protein
MRREDDLREMIEAGVDMVRRLREAGLDETADDLDGDVVVLQAELVLVE